MQRETIEELEPGAMDSEEVQKADKKLLVTFFDYFAPDQIATEGGEVPTDMMYDERIDEKGERTRTPTTRLNELKNLGCKIRPHHKWPEVTVVTKCGRLVTKPVEFVRIQRPGDRDTINERPVEDSDRKRFARAYKMWKENKSSDGVVGTPLEELPFINPGQREEFKFFGIRTVEHLVTMDDTVAARFPGITPLRNKARAYLEAADAKAPFREIDSKMEEKDRQISELQARLATLEGKKR